MTAREGFLGTGRIGDTIAESTPAWAAPRRPAPGAPDIVVVLLDDMGWSDFGCFGSEIATPTIDALAGDGLRMTNFQVTPLCSPTRASLLTGRDHHAIGMRFLAVADSGFPNSRGEVARDVTTIPAELRDRGYGTYLAGKWHLAPQTELTPAGPFHNWPLARGFERFYGFLGGASDQYAPELYRDNSPVPPSEDPDYHLSSDLVDRSIDYLRDHVAFRPDDPFYLQLAFGATHAPFQAPKEYIDRYRGRYDAGWDRLRAERLERQKQLGVVPAGTGLTERDPAVPEWQDLSDDEKRVAARGQEAFAGFLEHTDAQLARLVEWLREHGRLDNTLIAVFADNGAAGDGGRIGTTSVIGPYNGISLGLDQELAGLPDAGDPNHPAHYATGWAMSGNTPFRLYKQYVELGGVRSPLVLHWPDRIDDAGATRDQYTHVTDLAASLLDAAIEAAEPEREHLLRELDGKSFLPVLDHPDAPAPRETQVFEMLGHRAIWHRGWKATTVHKQGTSYDGDTWRLYDTTTDFSESRDLSATEPGKLAELLALWWAEARKSGLLPLDDRSLKELLGLGGPIARPLNRLVLSPGQSRLGFTTRLTGTDRSMRVTATLAGRAADDEGVLLASGTGYGGYVLYILGSRLCFEHNFLGTRVTCTSQPGLPTGDFEVGFDLVRGAGRSADVTLNIAGTPAGSVHIPVTSMQLAFYGLDVGKDPGSRVSTAYPDAFGFSPEVLRSVTIQFAEPTDQAHMAKQAEAEQ